MLQLGSKVLLRENSKIRAVRILHLGLKKRFKRARVSLNNIVKGSIINCKANKKYKLGDKINILLVHIKRKISRNNGIYIRFDYNYGVSLADPIRRKPIATKTKLTVPKEIRK